ncbi:hypothetical protein VF14_11590 [Nostoc linckia z18]|uniref:Uncharacterized protein n=2 Tax=Nostoc linckia TaxID=92942 RepID=A0A9Q5ZA01_NOSLI|nr:hypothetical protein VF02_23050 [Nostoc linckia z1]PHJ63811.1 hypothetical protein VF05_24015 [Nostoc linckia z3]PHJ70825.1 hypothetical protein VF03_21585 [Nostoc linckia z2]PHJ82666.1 hypothetical protein VF06_15580 [Nostoc linckia z4]PHJ88664.1 hypothetical protein VF07_15355 [Nostoc linckia z6]PHJ93804.1 hypothetical protein VF04_24620 [Nostoc linckia z7]PHK01770.1 hypothetical protein VF08_21155 [Nostoc linckia z8]PHK08356.1 hypothetical protein VF09_20200 [Nostoc linckia z9]PHK2214
MPKFNERIYNASLDALLSANVPKEIAEKTSEIVASDDGDLPNFGRSAEDQEIVNEAMRHYHHRDSHQLDDV